MKQTLMEQFRLSITKETTCTIIKKNKKKKMEMFCATTAAVSTGGQ